MRLMLRVGERDDAGPNWQLGSMAAPELLMQLQHLREDRTLMDWVVGEVLRYESSVQIDGHSDQRQAHT